MYTDNWYTSLTLANYLLNAQTYLCGTIKSNRRFYLKDLVNTELDKGQGWWSTKDYKYAVNISQSYNW